MGDRVSMQVSAAERRSDPSRMLKNSGARRNFIGLYVWDNRNSPRWMLKKADFSPAQPWRAETHLVPSETAAPQLTLVSRFTLLWSAARTMLADFFSILLMRSNLLSR